MSLPTPSTTSAIMGQFSEQELEAVEAPLVALATRCGGDLRKLLYAFFGFLHRRTDFYLVQNDVDVAAGTAPKMGFHEGDAEKILLAAFRQFPLRKLPSQSSSSLQHPPAPLAAAATAPLNRTAASTQQASTNDQTGELTVDTTVSNSKDSAELSTTRQDDPMANVRYTEKGRQVPVGNGGSTSRYRWTQTIDECTVFLGVPVGLRGKDFSVAIKPLSISVRSKQPVPDGESGTFLEGTLSGAVIPDESSWSIEGGVLILVLYKKTKTFWETILEGDEKIDTSLVDSRRHIHEYDESTQAQIRKIVFDQNQARQGLPTSGQILGGNMDIPNLPPGVEYIDAKILDDKTKNK